MKNHIPAEIDALMWSVAESGDDRALEEFGARYPQHRMEMLKRIELVRNLKGAKPEQVFAGTPPKFSPKESSMPIGMRKWAWVVAPVLLAGVAFGSYNVAIQYMKPPIQTTPVEPTAVRQGNDGLVDPLPDDAPPPIGTNEPQEPPIKTVPKDEVVAPYDQPLTVKTKKISLHAAIDLIGKSSSLDIELAPGLEDVDITMEFSNASAMMILQYLGKTYGFSVFEQEPGRVLIVPEVDPSKQDGAPVEPMNPSSDSIKPEIAPTKKADQRATIPH